MRDVLDVCRLCRGTPKGIAVVIGVLAAILTTRLQTPVRRAAAAREMRVLSHGYVDGRGKSATAIVGPDGISNITDIPFPHGGEISPDGRRIAFDTCDRSNRAIAIATLDNSVSVMPALTHSVAQPSAQSESVAPTTVALVESLPDGRTIYELTSTHRGSMWTPFFPRVDGYKLPEGATPVYAVQFGRVFVDRTIHVDISVLLGSAQPPGVPIASVVVSPGSPRVVIDALTKFGVQPVTLSMVDVVPMTPYLPTWSACRHTSKSPT